jgi:hypothetical protein
LDNIAVNISGERNFTSRAKAWSQSYVSSSAALIITLLFIKTAFQFIILDSGYRWLSADDFCRTVKSFEWYQHPIIYSGVWLSPHFWINGFVMLFIKDLFIAATLVNFIFSALSLIYFYKAIELCFGRTNAFFSTLIFCFFPFQVWLSLSGLPECIFFFFATAGIYYYLKWKSKDEERTHYLVLAAAAFALSNMFRYEGWLFSVSFIILIGCEFIKHRKFSKRLFYNLLISCISLVTVVWWLIQNQLDHGDMMFFASETTKIFKQFNSASFFQRVVQYPIFIFYSAPITTLFALKKIYDTLKSKNNRLIKLFLLFNLLELALLMLQGMMGTGGTNMVSRYIVLNAMLFIPFAVWQAYELKKVFTVILLTLFITINIIWSFYYPQPFREDTFEVGKLTKDLINSNYIGETGNIYFEEVEGYYDVFAVQALSNNPAKFVLGEFPLKKDEVKTKTSKTVKLSDEELNILDIKAYLEKNNIHLAVVKSDGYTDKLKKLSYRFEEIGDYKLFYIKNRESSINDSSISLLSDNITPLESNPDLVNFNKMLGIKELKIDNTNFGLNPQTVTIDWTATDKGILDSIDYDNFQFERYKSVIDIVNVDNDSSVYTQSASIFSDRNIEELIENNTIRNIIVLRPFAVLNYSKKYDSSPFDGGIYYLNLSIRDTKHNKSLLVYKGNQVFKVERAIPDTLRGKDTLKVKDSLIVIKGDTLKFSAKKNLHPKDSLQFAYNIGNIIAMFPDSDYNKIVEKKKDFIQITTRNWLQLLFSQRYQGDQVLNWIFTSF